MFGLGLPEIGIIAVVALLIFGPKKIPEMGSAIGKTLKGFKDEMNKTQEGAQEQESGGAEEQGGRGAGEK
ncbi:MAG: twin-arginine translocase TatA/TatE family subunit [Phormidium sp.]